MKVAKPNFGYQSRHTEVAIPKVDIPKVAISKWLYQK